MSLTLNQLEKVEYDHEDVLKRAFKEVLSNRAPHTESEFKSTLSSALDLFDNKNPEMGSLIKGSLDIKERKEYIERVKAKISEYLNIPNSRLVLTKIGWTVFLTATVKSALDLYDSYNTLRKIKKHKEDPKYIQRLQNARMKDIERYVVTYETRKLKAISKFRKRFPKIERPIVHVSGDYLRDRYHQSMLIGAFGELFDPVLLLLNKDDKVVDEIKSNIKNSKIKEDTKSIVLKELRVPDNVDEIINGHPVNFDLWIGNMYNIIKVTGEYFRYWDRKKSCLPFFEWEGVCTVLYPRHLIGSKTFYDPEAINLKIDYINAFRKPLGYKPIPHIRKHLEDSLNYIR